MALGSGCKLEGEPGAGLKDTYKLDDEIIRDGYL